ncbi:MAG TPA: VOC family protein, partial [Stellaceae bacterium]|nr:VOC family protein [Stellaceae bacterium]
MINLQDIRYVRLGTRDLEGAVDYATKILGLQLVGREGKSAYFRSDKVEVRGDTRDHTLVYFEGDPSDHTIGFDLKDPADFDQIGAALDNAGYGAQAATKEECEKRRARGVIQTRDPTGNKIEIVARPYHSGTRTFQSRDAGITHFSHIGLNSTNPVVDETYW